MLELHHVLSFALPDGDQLVVEKNIGFALAFCTHL